MNNKSSEKEIDLIDAVCILWRFKYLVLTFSILVPIMAFSYLTTRHLNIQPSSNKQNNTSEFVVGFTRQVGGAQSYGLIFKELLQSVSLHESLTKKAGIEDFTYSYYRNHLRIELDARQDLLKVSYVAKLGEDSLNMLKLILDEALNIFDKHEIEKKHYIVIDPPHLKKDYVDVAKHNMTKSRILLFTCLSSLLGFFLGSLLAFLINFFQLIKSSPRFG